MKGRAGILILAAIFLAIGIHLFRFWLDVIAIVLVACYVASWRHIK